MRFIKRAKIEFKDGDERTKLKFLLFPKTLANKHGTQETRWLEWSWVRQQFIVYYGYTGIEHPITCEKWGWFDKEWAPDPVGYNPPPQFLPKIHSVSAVPKRAKKG